jgi:hypothetical protein
MKLAAEIKRCARVAQLKRVALETTRVFQELALSLGAAETERRMLQVLDELSQRERD